MYVSHQNEKKTEYGPRASEIEKATLLREENGIATQCDFQEE